MADISIINKDNTNYNVKDAAGRLALAEVENKGAKNIFVTSAGSSTIKDCTFTNNNDGTWTTTSSGAVAERRQKALFFTVPSTLPSGDYVLSGCPSGGASATTVYYCLYIWDLTENARVTDSDTGSGIVFSWIPNPTHTYSIAIDIRKGTNPNGLIFKPMICTKAEWDISHSYVPYALQNPTLTPAVIKAVDEGAKNRLPLTGESTDIFTINADGTMTANGSSSASKRDFAYYIGAPPKGRFVFSGCPPTGSNTTYRMFLQSVVGSTYTTLATLTGDPVEVDLTNIDKIRVLMSIYAGYAPNNIKFSPMLCTKAEWDISHEYKPYALPNPVLTQTAIKAVDEGSKNKCKITATTQTVRNVTFTVDAESGTITANGTANATDSIIISDTIATTEEMFLTGTPSGASGYNVRFGSSATYRDTGSGVSIPSGLSNSIYIAFNSGTAFNNVVLKPMICTKAEWDISQAYVPYGKTNAELTAENISQQSEIDYVVNTGAKNLLKNERTTTTHKGIKFTVNNDGSVTANGTNDGTGASVLDINTQTSLALSNGDYILTGCPTGGSDSGYMMDITRSPGSSIKDTGSGVTFTVGGDYTVNEFRIVISKNITVNNLTFYPMIRPASIADDTFVPYALPNPTLTPAAIKAVDEGAKNLLHITAQSQTVNGVTFTVNDDQTITVNGTASATATCMLVPNAQAILIPDGDYILSGCPYGGGDSTYDLRWYLYSSGKSAYDKGSGALVTKNGNTTSSNIAIVIRPGATANNLVFKPMLCTKAEWDISHTYVPYAPTNRELYEEKIDHDLPVVSGSILDYADTFAPGIYFARQSSATGSGKPVNNRRYVYNIYVYSSATATIMAIEGEDPGNPRMYLTNKVSGTWGSWYKFEGTKVT